MFKIEEDLKSLSGIEFINRLKNNEITEKEYKKYLEKLFEEMEKNEYNEWISTIKLEDIEKIDIKDLNNKKRLNGLLIAVKDNIMTNDFITTAGTPEFKKWKPKINHSVVNDLINNGCVITGKTNLHELALGVTSSNDEYGKVKNPNNKNMIPGGSSGGSAVVAKKMMSHIAIGTDTCGSCRIPASLTGCFRYRPTINMYSNDNIVPISRTLDTIGFFANNIEDIELIDNNLEKKLENIIIEKEEEKIKIIVYKKYFWENLEKGDETEEICNNFINNIKEKIIIEEDNDSNILNEFNMQYIIDIINYEWKDELTNFIIDNNIPTDYEKVTNNIKSNFIKEYHKNMGKPEHLEKYNKSIKKRKELIESLKKYYNEKKADIIIYPTTPLSAIKIGQKEDLNLVKKFTQNSCIGSYLGFPCISIPIGYNSNKLPIGIEIMGLPKTDRSMIKIVKKLIN